MIISKIVEKKKCLIKSEKSFKKNVKTKIEIKKYNIKKKKMKEKRKREKAKKRLFNRKEQRKIF